MVPHENSNIITVVTKKLLLLLYRGMLRTLAQSEPFMQAFSATFNDIPQYSAKFRNIQALLRRMEP